MKFVVYGSSSCGYCTKATDLLERQGYGGDYRYIDIQNNPDARRFIVEEKVMKTVPQIFVTNNDKTLEHIGGYEELVDYLSG